MKKLLALSVVLAVVFLNACETPAFKPWYATFDAVDLNPQIISGELQQKIDNFVVIVDASASMGDDYSGLSGYRSVGAAGYNGTKLDMGKDLLNKFNKSIPGIPLDYAVLSFGFGACLNWESVLVNQSLTQYSPENLNAAIGSLQCSGGGTPLSEALWIADDQLAPARGGIALLIFSDGKSMSAVGQAAALKDVYGDRLCIHTIWVGNNDDQDGQVALQHLAESSDCGRSVDGKDIYVSQAMGDFVKSVFFSAGPSPFVDGDDDRDGISNMQDKCPHTPSGAIVDKDGCWAFHGELFEVEGERLKPEFDIVLQNALVVLARNPEITAEIQVHTDNFGMDKGNMERSTRCATALKKHLIQQGIAASRLSSVGYGESQPVVANDTDSGRLYNNRVVYNVNGR